MNTKLLKQKILDLAIRGKLTQQLKSDGTTKDLLKQISEQKRESSSTLSSPRRRGSPSAQSEKTIIPLDKSEAPFEIPANWEWVRLGDVGKWQSGTTPSKSNSAYYKDGTIPWLNTGDLNDGIINDIPKRVTEKALAETSLRLNEAGSVCIAMYGATIGKLGILSMPATTNQACCVCNNLKSFVNRMWLFFFLMNHKQEFIEAGFGGAQPNISKEKIVSTMFPLPPLAEQQRIVAKIEEAFAEIDAIEKNKELLKTHIKQTRQKILDLAIHGKLVPQNKSDEPASVLLERITRDNPHYEKMGLDERRETKDERSFKDKCHSREGGNLLAPISKDEIPFDIPENWIWCRLGDILAPMQSTTPKGAFFKYIDIDAIDNSTCRIKAPKMIESKNAPSRASRFTKKGDILFSLVRPYLRNIAKVTENDCIASTGFFVCSPIIVNSDFCFFLLTSNYVVDGLNQFMKGDNSPSISSQNLIDFTIPVPPLAEQSRIVAKIEELFAELDLVLQNV